MESVLTPAREGALVLLATEAHKQLWSNLTGASVDDRVWAGE
jgi:hypothetical protein